MNTMMKSNLSGSFKKLYKQYGMVIILCLLVVLSSIINPLFMTKGNIINLIKQISVSGVLALGMTFVMISGAVDLSAGNLIGLTGCLALLLQRTTMGVGLSILCAMCAGMVVGMCNGFSVSKGMPPFIVTLAMTQVIKGISYNLTQGGAVAGKIEAYRVFGGGSISFIPMPVIIFAALVVMSHFILKRTKIGRSIYALGGNKEAARLAGINVQRVRIIVYMISGLFASMAGIVYTSRVFSGDALTGDGTQMEAIAAVVIGGTRMSGGEGNVIRTVIGACVMGIMSNMLNLNGVSSYTQTIVKGLIIFVAVAADTWNQKQ